MVMALLSIVIVSQDTVVIMAAGSNYYPYHLIETPIKTFDLTFYSAIVKHVSKVWWVSETQVYESASNTLPREWLPFFIGGVLFALSSTYWVFLAKILGTSLVFLLAYLLLGRWIEGKPNRLFLASFFVLFTAIFGAVSLSPPDFFSKLSRILLTAPLFLNRFHSPVLTLPFLLIAIYFTLKAFDAPSRRNRILAGISAGLLFYTYFYYIAFFAGLFLVIIHEFLNREGKKIPPSLQVLGVAVLTALPYVFIILMNSLSGLSSDMILRLGLGEVSRPYYILPTITYILFAFSSLLILKKPSKEKIFFLGIIFFCIAAMNLQVIAGVNLQFIHWQQQVIDPLAFLFLLSMFSSWKKGELKIPFPLGIEKLSALCRKAVPILLAVILLLALNLQFNEAKKSCKGNPLAGDKCAVYTINPPEREAMDWLKENSSSDDVVMALSSETNARISADTGLFVFLPNGFTTTAKNSEIERRIGFSYRFYSVPKPTLEYLLTPQKETLQVQSVSNRLEGDWNLLLAEKTLFAVFPFHFLYHSTGLWSAKKFESALKGWPAKVREEIEKAGYEGNNFFYPKETAGRILAVYDSAIPDEPGAKITWVWVGEYERLVSQGIYFPSARKVFDNNSVAIYAYAAN